MGTHQSTQHASTPGRCSQGALPAQSLVIERAPLATLVPDPSNARIHGEQNLAAIEASLRRFGQAEPLIVQRSTRRIIGGHGRLSAMSALGWKECDVAYLDVDDREASALSIALNRSAELAEWDPGALTRLLSQLRADDDLAGVGFDEEDVDNLLASLGEESAPQALLDPGPGAPSEHPVSRLGDLWELGDHRLLCGDSTDGGTVNALMAGQTASLLSTDPPYCVGYTGADRPVVKGKASGKDWSALYREIEIADYGDLLRGFLGAAEDYLEEAAPHYIWHAHVQQPVLAKVLEERGILFHQVIIWAKPTATFGHSFFHWRHEPCAFGWKRGHRPTHPKAQFTTVWEVDWDGHQRVSGNEHPTQKPLRLFEIPMELHTRAGDVVFEPFSGSGTQILAAQRCNRRCFAVEICPAFVDVAVRRWEHATGGQARLSATGSSFEEVACARSTAP